MAKKSATVALEVLHYPKCRSNHDKQTSYVHGVDVLSPGNGAA